MGENEQGGMLRVITVLGLIAIIASAVIGTTIVLKGKADSTSKGVSDQISKAANPTNTTASDSQNAGAVKGPIDSASLSAFNQIDQGPTGEAAYQATDPTKQFKLSETAVDFSKANYKISFWVKADVAGPVSVYPFMIFMSLPNVQQYTTAGQWQKIEVTGTTKSVSNVSRQSLAPAITPGYSIDSNFQSSKTAMTGFTISDPVISFY
jgi:hypothetical protein